MNFETKLDNWLNEVANKCHKIASNKHFDLDFYVFQSAIHYNPKLMFIGANPGGEKSYAAKNKEENRERRTKFELGEGENTFIKYYEDSNWSKIRPLYDMFKGDPVMEDYFKNAVITNISYFNSGTFQVLKDKMNIVGKEPLNFCVNKNLELIKDIIHPENIIIMGAHARDILRKHLDEPLLTIAETNGTKEKKKVPLIKKSHLKYTNHNKEISIPVYFIEHPSAWNGLNNKENIAIKRDVFKKLFNQ